MKKLFLIPAILLIASFFITCDLAEGDWSKIPDPTVLDIPLGSITHTKNTTEGTEEFSFASSYPILNELTGRDFKFLVVVTKESDSFEYVDNWAGGKTDGVWVGPQNYWQDFGVDLPTLKYSLKGMSSVNFFDFKGGASTGFVKTDNLVRVYLTQK